MLCVNYEPWGVWNVSCTAGIVAQQLQLLLIAYQQRLAIGCLILNSRVVGIYRSIKPTGKHVCHPKEQFWAP